MAVVPVLLLSAPALAGDPKDDSYLPGSTQDTAEASENSTAELRSGGQESFAIPEGSLVTDDAIEVPKPTASDAAAAEEVAISAATPDEAVGGGAEATGVSSALSDNPNVVIDAVIAKGAPILEDEVSYRVERLESGMPKEVVANYSGQEAALELPQGRYRVTATYGRTVVQDDITIDSSPSSHTVNLNAGYIDLEMIPHVGGETVATPIDWKILTFGKDYRGKRELLHEIPDSPRTSVVLPAGWYIVQAWEGEKLTKHAIEVVPGATLIYTLVRR